MVISTVIFDLNGVLVQGEYLSERLEKEYGILELDVVAAIHEIMPKLREPNAVSAWSLWKPYIKKWNLSFSEEEFLSYWYFGEGLNKELIAYVKELKQSGIRVFILSNNFKERFNFYKKEISPLLDLVDKVYFSFQTGFVKPNPKAWKNILDEFTLDPKHCLYVDDSSKNVVSAQNLGITAVKYSSVEALRNLVNSI